MDNGHPFLMSIITLLSLNTKGCHMPSILKYIEYGKSILKFSTEIHIIINQFQSETTTRGV